MSGVTISGGANLKALLQTVANQRADVKAGFFEGREYPDGTPVAYVAAIQEFGEVIDAKSGGTITIPARPFMSDTLKINKPKWHKLFGNLIKAQGQDIDVPLAFNTIGLFMQGDIKDQINSDGYQKNASSTLAHKLGTHPLIDTHVMVNSVDYEVTK